MPSLTQHPSAFLWQNSLSTDNQFCEAVVRAGFLTREQMLHAAARYCIGSSKRGGVIFWQIDHEGRVHDGKVMYYLPDCHRNKDKEAHPTWVSAILARREAALARVMHLEPITSDHATSHCFFGEHLLSIDKDQQLTAYCLQLTKKGQPLTTSPLPEEGMGEAGQLSPIIAIVEAEKSAFILSELYPQYIWMASGGLGEVQPDKFHPLRGRNVVMFPDTDPDGIAFRRWSEAADLVMHQLFWEDSPPIRVSPLLEQHATAEQKQRKIDIVDFLFETGNN